MMDSCDKYFVKKIIKSKCVFFRYCAENCIVEAHMWWLAFCCTAGEVVLC